MKIELGKTYYFNNRVVVPVKSEGGGFYMCIAEFSIDNHLEGSQWCTACMIGGDYKGAHVCDDYEDVIEYLIDEIDDSEIFWVKDVYLKENPFEYRENQMLLKENKKQLERLKGFQLDERASVAVIRKMTEIILEQKNKINENIKTLAVQKNETGILRRHIDSQEEQLQGTVEVNGTIKNITKKELLQLLKAKIKLNLLEIGGVDNWTYYGECIGGVDINDEALNELINM